MAPQLVQGQGWGQGCCNAAHIRGAHMQDQSGTSRGRQVDSSAPSAAGICCYSHPLRLQLLHIYLTFISLYYRLTSTGPRRSSAENARKPTTDRMPG